MLNRCDLRVGTYYMVQGMGNDVFRVGEKVLLLAQEENSYIFKQGTIQVVIKETSLEKFLSSMNFKAIA